MLLQFLYLNQEFSEKNEKEMEKLVDLTMLNDFIFSFSFFISIFHTKSLT